VKALLLQENIPLAAWTTFGVGGPARYFVDAVSDEDVVNALDFAKVRKLPLFVLGGGSNLVVADEGFPGLVLRVGILGREWNANGDETELRAGAGEDWDSLVAACVAKSLGGVECLSGIPGLAGGTPIQNVGAYGQETSDVLVRVRALDRLTESIVDLSRVQCGFAYRSSVFNTTHKERYIVLRVTYALKQNPTPCVKYPDLVARFDRTSAPPALADVRQAVREIRGRKGMLIVEGDPDCRSAGSFFKNPVLSEAEYLQIQRSAKQAVPRYPAGQGKVKTSAAWLIENAGYPKGFSMGPVAVSSKHTLALVNAGGATAADIVRLAGLVQRTVEERFGVRLIPEPVFVGFNEQDPLGAK
jgi:UDP-N-acetylmuramate dehydrogenase